MELRGYLCVCSVHVRAADGYVLLVFMCTLLRSRTNLWSLFAFCVWLDVAQHYRHAQCEESTADVVCESIDAGISVETE